MKTAIEILEEHSTALNPSEAIGKVMHEQDSIMDNKQIHEYNIAYTIASTIYNKGRRAGIMSGRKALLEQINERFGEE